MSRIARFEMPLPAELLVNRNFFELYPFDGGGRFIQQETAGSADDREIVKAILEGGALKDFGPSPEEIDFLKFERWSSIEKSCWINRMYFIVPLARVARQNGDLSLARKVRSILLRFSEAYPPPATCEDACKLHRDVLYARDHDYNAKGFDFDAPIPYQWFDFQPASRIMNILHALWFLRDMKVFTPEDLETLEHLLYLHGQNIYWTEAHVPREPGNHQALRGMALMLAASFFRDLPESRDWLKVAADVCEYHILHDFLEDGMIIDLSPSYHFFESWIVRDSLTLAKRENVSFSPAALERAEKIFEVCRTFRQPDGFSPAVNDAYSFDMSGFLASLPTAAEPAEYRMLPKAGFAIHQGKEDFLLLDCSPLVDELSHYHGGKQAVTLFVHGVPFLADSGCCSYDDPDFSEYYKQPFAHSSLLVDGHGDGVIQGRYLWLHAAECTLSDWKDGRISCAMATTAPGWEGVRWERKITIREEAREIVLDDSVFSSRSIRMTFLFNLHSGVSVRKEDGTAILEHGGKTIRIRFPGAFEMRESKSYRDFRKVPNRQLVFEQTAPGGSFRTEIRWV